MEERRCMNHGDARASARCTVCERLFCAECLTYDMEKPYCACCLQEGIAYNRKLTRPCGLSKDAIAAFALMLLSQIAGLYAAVPGWIYAGRAHRKIRFYPKLTGLWLVYASHVLGGICIFRILLKWTRAYMR
jgi:hypothetical protein